MTFRKIIKTDKAPAAVGTYSQGVEHNGVYYFSGQIGLDPETMKLRETFEEQLDQIMTNIDGLLNSTGLGRDNIIKTSIFMMDLGDFDKVNKVYTEYFEEPFPARSCVAVASLPKDALIEIEVIAAK
jgi:2-iminobutanoate/2-iminopropanoate deaminase